ncbi:hypothetical protein Tco_0137496, partial [Tanacetum coccineum]
MSQARLEMIASMGIDAANGTPWTEVRKWMTEEDPEEEPEEDVDIELEDDAELIFPY